MKTYAESQGLTPVDWTAALQKDCAEMTNEEVEQLVEAAENWKLCACGSLCDAIPRGDSGTPRDAILRIEGRAFMDCLHDMRRAIGNDFPRIANEQRRSAIATHQRIEQRAAFLLAEIQDKTV